MTCAPVVLPSRGLRHNTSHRSPERLDVVIPAVECRPGLSLRRRRRARMAADP